MVRGKSQGWAKEWRLSGPDAAALHFATAAAAKAAGAGAAELMSLYNTALVSLDRQPLSQAGPGAAAAVTDACKLFLGSSEVRRLAPLRSSTSSSLFTLPLPTVPSIGPLD